MAKVKDDYVFKLKGGEASVLECVNPFLERREPIVVFFENGQTNIKIGDGKNNYNSLPFISDTNIDISDIQGLTEILAQYEVDLENLNSKIDKIVIDKVYDPNSNNAQSGKAVSQAIAEMIDSAPETLDTLNELANALGDDPNFATTVLNKISEKPGQATQNGCIIFNDYVNNLSGIKAFSMRQLAGQPSVTNPNYLSVPVMLNTVEGLSENDVVSGTLVIRNAEGLAADTYYWFKDFGYIASIGENNIITLNIAMQYASQLDINNIIIPKCNITVTKNPNLGDILLGELSTAFGENTQALGKGSIAQGKDSLAYGEYSHAEGWSTRSSGISAHAEGNRTQANGTHSHAEGFNTKATNLNTHAEGNGTQARGEDSHTEGFNTMTYGPRSHAEGDETVTGVSTSSGDGYAAHAEGVRSKAAGFASHSEGQNTQAIGAESHAEGYYTEAVGDCSHTEGFYTKASGGASHAEGENTEAIGQSSHAQGYYTKAIGKYSHAEGFNTEANHNYSHASGANTKTGADCQTVVGKYNDVSNNSLFVVGNGSYDGDRKNAFEVKVDGSATLQKQGTTDNSIVIKSTLVGQKTLEGGISFNGNDAIGDGAQASGLNTQAGTLARKIVANGIKTYKDENNSQYYEITVKGLVNSDNLCVDPWVATDSYIEGTSDLVTVDCKTHLSNALYINSIEENADTNTTTITIKRIDNRVFTALSMDDTSGTDMEEDWIYVAGKSNGEISPQFTSAFVAGKDSIATGFAATSFGRKNISAGNYSTTFGRGNKASYAGVAAGVYNEAGNGGIALGNSNKALGDAAVATGTNTYARAASSRAGGRESQALSEFTVAEGLGVIAGLKQGQVVHGKYNVRNDSHLLIIGDGNSNTERHDAFVITEDYKVLLNNGTVELADTKRVDNILYGSKTLNDTNNEASGTMALATGSGTTASGSYSFAGGVGSEATARSAVAIGEYNKATVQGGFAGGINAEANGFGTIALGYGVNTINSAPVYGQMAVGKYNAPNPYSLFMVGNGTSKDDRKNVFEVHKTGDVKIANALILTDSTNGKEYKIYINDGKLQLEEV